MNIWKRGMALLLCLLLCLGVLPGTAFATDRPDEAEEPAEEENTIQQFAESGTQSTSNDFSISEHGVAFICEREGFHANCYKDNTQSSIGYGTKCTGSTTQPHAAGLHSITKEAALAEMKSQINSTYAPRVRAQTAGINMNQNQFDALVSLCYNCGGGSNLIFNSPLVRYLKGQLSEAEAREEYSNYIVTSGGQVSQGLINRRNAEANLFFSSSFDPVWPSSGYDVSCLYYYKDGSKHSTRYGYLHGIDIAATGDACSIEAGTVVSAVSYADEPNNGFGNYVVIEHNNGSRSLYAHLASYCVTAGDPVTRGQKIGVIGGSGKGQRNYWAVHLHFEYDSADPWLTIFRDKYYKQITFQPNVYSNNKAALNNGDKNVSGIVSFIENYCTKTSHL